ncbi:hypothetical protein [Cohnella mopanensis]|uniref:hypothetical protein n=1 Tax=Cohnella mopanensis TaxID=2911966 RepID=UPI001EF788D1|nr:hypothetical protein [Cohnella mopanensis]
MINKSSIFGDEENKYAWMERSQRAGDCWKPVRLPCGMGLGAESETTHPRGRKLNLDSSSYVLRLFPVTGA